MNKIWTRDDTKSWISQLQDRITDINDYLQSALEWCDHKEIDDERIVFMCCFLTCIWVSQCRGEDITYTELMEIMGVEIEEFTEEKFYELDAKYADMTHRELLENALIIFNDSGTWD